MIHGPEIARGVQWACNLQVFGCSWVQRVGCIRGAITECPNKAFLAHGLSVLKKEMCVSTAASGPIFTSLTQSSPLPGIGDIARAGEMGHPRALSKQGKGQLDCGVG